MDCIFKVHGIIPPNHICRGCIPLHMLLCSVGHNKKEATIISKRIFRAYQIVSLEDKYRDETTKIRFISKVLSIFLMLTLPRQLQNTLKNVETQIRNLEKNEVSTTKYINEVSKQGGLIFANATISNSQKKKLQRIGTIIAGATLVHDMNKDLQSDLKAGKFNGFKNCSQEKAESLIEQNTEKFIKLTKPVLITKSETSNKHSQLRILRHKDFMDYIQFILYVVKRKRIR